MCCLRQIVIDIIQLLKKNVFATAMYKWYMVLLTLPRFRPDIYVFIFTDDNGDNDMLMAEAASAENESNDHSESWEMFDYSDDSRDVATNPDSCDDTDETTNQFVHI